nr:hypothetical protein [Tanacetum cinerariifolium]
MSTFKQYIQTLLYIQKPHPHTPLVSKSRCLRVCLVNLIPIKMVTRSDAPWTIYTNIESDTVLMEISRIE